MIFNFLNFTLVVTEDFLKLFFSNVLANVLIIVINILFYLFNFCQMIFKN